MAKNKHKKKHPPSHRHRNAAPRAPRAPQLAEGPETNTQRLGYTAAGAAGTSLVGALLTKQGWAPKTVASGLTLLGAGLGWKGDTATVRSVGVGTMSAAGAQLALMLWDDHEKKATPRPAATTASASAPTAQKQLSNGNGDDLPSEALESAFNRARLAMAVGG